MKIEEAIGYVFSDSVYDPNKVNDFLSLYGINFVQSVFYEINNGRIIDERRFNRLMEDIFTHYEYDPKSLELIDKVLVQEIERLKQILRQLHDKQ